MSLLRQLIIAIVVLVGVSGTLLAQPERRANHLKDSHSPYLLQHVHNPVDWYPWGEEAIAKAKRENKPIFLSIGYSACHWCHVMERESFQDAEVAKILNENFVCIKVDREERPDIDAQYILAVSLLNGSAGWPASVWLTPDLKPYFGGTYYPKKVFLTLLKDLHAAWRDQKPKVEEFSETVARNMQAIAEAAVRKSSASLPANIMDTSVRAIKRGYDKKHGGFGTASKFPLAPRLRFLLERYESNPKDTELRAMLVDTLDRMALGGLYDHLGGGFHRYTVDKAWKVPHFEKMLYDQAQMTVVYAKAYNIFKKPLYKKVVAETLNYCLREMASPEGGFWATLDADSNGVEGAFYVWKPGQVVAILGKQNAAIFNARYGVTAKGNFEEGATVLGLKSPLTDAEVKKYQPWLKSLYNARAKRIRPGTDDKIIVSWNGLMLAALAEGYGVTKDARYLEAAKKTQTYIASAMTAKDGSMLRAMRRGKSNGQTAFLEDYAFYADGLLSLYAITKDEAWLKNSRRVVEVMRQKFLDKDDTGAYLSRGFAGAPIAKMPDGEDGAMPSASGKAAVVVARLAIYPAPDAPPNEASQLRKEAQQTVQAFQRLVVVAPAGVNTLLRAWKLASEK